MRFATPATFALLFVLWPGICRAQRPDDTGPPQTIEEVRKVARVHVGPFYLTPGVNIKEVGVDTNVFNDGEKAKSDFTATASPLANMWLPVARRALFHAFAASDLVWYTRFASERSVDPQVSGDGSFFVHRLTVTGGYAYLNTRQRPNYELDLRSRRLERTGTLGVKYAMTPKFSVAVSGRHSILEYDADAVFEGTQLHDTMNRRTTGGAVELRQRLTPLTSIGLRAEAFGDRFPFAPERNADSVRVMPGVEFQPRALLKGSAYVGYRSFRAKNPALLPDFSGLVSDVTLGYTLKGSMAFKIHHARDVEYSFQPTQPYFVDTTIGLALRRALGSKYDAVASVDRHAYAYRDLRASGLGPSTGKVSRLDIVWISEASVGYRVGRTARLAFGVMYIQREAPDASAHNYDGLRIRATMASGF